MTVPANPIRVLFIQSHTDIGGAEIALLELTRNLNVREVEATVALLGFGHGPLGEQLRRQGTTVTDVPATRFRNLLAAGGAIVRLTKIIRGGFDLVVANGGHPLLFARPAAFLAGVPCVWWVHGCEPKDALRGSLITWAVQLLSADEFFANSEFTAGMLARMFPSHRPARVVHCGVDMTRHRFCDEHREAARRELGITGDAAVVGIFGRLQPWKGQHIFLQAAALLKNRKCNCRYLVVGGTLFGLNPGYPAALGELSDKLGLNGDVSFLGHREDSDKLMSACDVVVHASIEPEPWGLVVAEAMANGRAVVATAAGGPLEMIRPGETGVLVPAGDAQAMADSVESLLREPGLRQRLGEAARRHAEMYFETHKTAQMFSDELRAAHARHN